MTSLRYFVGDNQRWILDRFGLEHRYFEDPGEKALFHVRCDACGHRWYAMLPVRTSHGMNVYVNGAATSDEPSYCERCFVRGGWPKVKASCTLWRVPERMFA